MRFVAIFLLIFIFSFSFAADYKQIIRGEISKQFGNAAKEENILLDYNHFVTIKGDTFVVPNGYHYVFKLIDGKPIRKDKSIFHGSNFGRYLFSWNNQIYALGGYGFFNTNSHLEYFNPKLEGWAVEKTNGEVPPFLLGISYLRGSKIISFNNFKSGNLVEKDVLDSSLYMLDLKTKKWTKKVLNNSVCFDGQVLYAEHYIAYLGEIESFIIDKKTLKFVKFNNDKFGVDFIHNEITAVEFDQILFNSYENHRKLPLKLKLDLKKIWLKHPKEDLIVPGNFKRGIHISIWIYLVIIGLISFVIFQFMRRNKSSKLGADYNELELRLLGENRLLNTEELDEILGIEHMDVDSKKFKRNRMINEMNQRHAAFITRIKDDTDKRRFLYQIKK